MRSIVLCISFAISLVRSPLVLGGYLFIIARVISFWIGSHFSSWMACSVLIMYLGGLMVLFSYFIAVRPNHLIDREFSAQWSIAIIFINLGAPSVFLGRVSQVLSLSILGCVILAGLILFFGIVVVAKITDAQYGAFRAYK